jgi:hypothetical protein
MGGGGAGPGGGAHENCEDPVQKRLVGDSGEEAGEDVHGAQGAEAAKLYTGARAAFSKQKQGRYGGSFFPFERYYGLGVETESPEVRGY